MTDEVPIVRELPEDLHTRPPDYLSLDQRATFMGHRWRDGRVGARNFVLIVPTSMCASHEALQISTIAEFTLYDRVKYPNVGGVVLIDLGCEKTIGNAIAPVIRLAANTPRFRAHVERSAGGVIDGTETIDEVANACSNTSLR